VIGHGSIMGVRRCLLGPPPARGLRRWRHANRGHRARRLLRWGGQRRRQPWVAHPREL